MLFLSCFLYSSYNGIFHMTSFVIHACSFPMITYYVYIEHVFPTTSIHRPSLSYPFIVRSQYRVLSSPLCSRSPQRSSPLVGGNGSPLLRLPLLLGGSDMSGYMGRDMPSYNHAWPRAGSPFCTADYGPSTHQARDHE